MIYYQYTGAKHSYYSRYIVTSRRVDSLLGIQFSVSRMNFFDRLQNAADGCNRVVATQRAVYPHLSEMRETGSVIRPKLFSFQKPRIIPFARESIHIPGGNIVTFVSFEKLRI